MTTIKLRRSTASEWSAANPVLAEGEPGFEKDSGKYKIGDGVKTWSNLTYYSSDLANSLLFALKTDVPRRLPWLELVPFLIIGDSYGQGGGTTDCDLGTTYFDRLGLRHRTQTAVNRSVGGKRSDEILMQQVIPNWVPNTRGLVGIADVVLNDCGLYNDATKTPTTAAAFRSILTYLTARYVAGLSDAGVQFGPGWTSGVSSTAGSYVDVSFVGDSCSILTTAVTGTGGTLSVKNPAGTTVATITTGSFAQTFTQSTKIGGFGSGSHTVRVALVSGSASLVGVAHPSPTPPVISWVKPGPRNIGTDSLIVAYLAACSSVLADFPSVIPVDMDSSYSYSTMLGPSAHPNDRGNAYICDLIEKSLLTSSFGQGLNRITTATAAAPYTPVSPVYSGAGALAPAQVTGLTATPSNQITLAWTRPADNGATITGYSVRYSLAGANSWTTWGTAPSGSAVQAIISSGLTAGSSYDFQVAAINSAGTGPWSATATATPSAAVVTYASDTFTRSDTTGGPGALETGGLTWSVVSGDSYEVVANRLKALVITTNPADCFVDDGQADGTLSLTLVNGATVGGLVFRRAADGSTGYVFYNNGSGWFFKKRTGVNTYVTLGTGPAVAAASGDVAKVILNGSTITCQVNGVNAFAPMTDASYTGTRHGVWTGAANNSFDSFSHTSATS